MLFMFVEDLEKIIFVKVSFESEEDKKRIVSGLKWIGLFFDEVIIFKGNLLDMFCVMLEKKM